MPSDLNVATQYTPHIPHASSPGRGARGVRAWRFGPWVRLRTFIRVAELDTALAGGADPRASRELALRAQQLRSPRKRIALARAIERVVASVTPADARIAVGVFRPGPVINNGPLLLALAERLRAAAPVRLRGLAMVDRFLHESDSTLYGAESAVELEREVTSLLAALEPEDASDAEEIDPVMAGSRSPDPGRA